VFFSPISRHPRLRSWSKNSFEINGIILFVVSKFNFADNNRLQHRRLLSAYCIHQINEKKKIMTENRLPTRTSFRHVLAITAHSLLYKIHTQGTNTNSKICFIYFMWQVIIADQNTLRFFFKHNCTYYT